VHDYAKLEKISELLGEALATASREQLAYAAAKSRKLTEELLAKYKKPDPVKGRA
jgi:hypothetical protein